MRDLHARNDDGRDVGDARSRNESDRDDLRAPRSWERTETPARQDFPPVGTRRGPSDGASRAGDRPVVDSTSTDDGHRIARIRDEQRAGLRALTDADLLKLENFEIDHDPLGYLKRRGGRALDAETLTRTRAALEQRGLRASGDLKRLGLSDAWDIFSRPGIDSVKEVLEPLAPRDAEPVAVTGFDRSTALSSDEIRGLLHDRLPERGEDGLAHVRYIDTFRADGREVTLGEYDPRTRSIEIFRQTPDGCANRELLEQTVLHEAGHHVYWTRLDDADRRTWEELSRGGEPSAYVTSYARTGVREDFAESFAFFASQREVLEDASPAKCAFMEALWQKR